MIGDLSGQHPVYWRWDDGRVRWATAAAPLAALDGSSLDTVVLAARLACGLPDVTAERSLFRSVQRVPSGHLVILGDGPPRVERYEPTEYEPQPLNEAAPFVGAALGMAVDCRLETRRPVSSDLAGLDSTALACLAARRGQVTAVTFADPRVHDDDLPYARRTTQAVDGIHHYVAPGNAQTVYYAGLENPSLLPFTDAPHAYTVTTQIRRAALDQIAIRHSRPGVHFTGAAGDTVLDASPVYLADLLRTGQYRLAWSHAQQRARLHRTSVWRVVAAARPAARTDLAASMRQTADTLRDRPRDWVPQSKRAVSWVPLLATADWMSPDVREQLAEELRKTADQITCAPSRLSVWDEQQELAQVGADVTGWRALALAEYGIELAVPYLDNEVIRACLAVPPEQRGAPDTFKPLLAAAFPNGPIPRFVLERTTKGGLAGVSSAGVTQNLALLRDMLLGPDSQMAGLGLITDTLLRDQLHRAGTGQPFAIGALHLAVSIEVWLRQIAHTDENWWTQAQTGCRAGE